MRNTIIYIFICLLLPLNAVTQEIENDLLRALLTDIAAQSEDGQDVEQLMDLLEDLAENPVPINDASFEDLSRIAWLTEFQIKSLIEHVTKHGPIVSCYEIAYLYGFTPELAQTLVPFVSLVQKPVNMSIRPERVLRYGRNKVIAGTQSVLQKQEAYARPDSVENKYQGSPFKASLRYSFSYANRVYWGLTAEKDAGEPFFRKKNAYGFDFYSAHFQISGKGLLKTLTLGDFRADFGQGLILWSGMSYGKSSIVMNAMRYNAGLRKYSAANENQFMRGSGVTLRLHPVDVSIAYSRKAVDANVSNDGAEEPLFTLVSTGYHRTPNEMKQKRAMMEQIAATNISVTRTDWHIGATAVYYQYDGVLLPNPRIYNRFAFTGKSNSNYSIDFRFRLGDAMFYGEQALAQNGALGMLYGVQMLISEHLGANLMYRYYAKDFHAQYGRALGENAANNNEEGFYVGWNWNLGGKWRLSSYWDIFRFPWLRYRTDAPSHGQDVLLRADYTPLRDTKIYAQIRYKEKEENATEQVVNMVKPVRTTSARLLFSHQLIEGCGIGNHLEIKNYRKDGIQRNGYLLAQDVYVTVNMFKKFPLRITFRYALFDTDDYNARVYSYEHDMLYAFSIPAFYDQGTRLYLLLKYSPGKHIDLRLRFATTHYSDRDVVGSGLNEVQGNRLSEAKIQLVCKF